MRKRLYHVHLRRILLFHIVMTGAACAFRSLSHPQKSSSMLSIRGCKATSAIVLLSFLDPSKIELQSDCTKFGRGDLHLSAMIEEGDVVVYQTGSWMVDGVPVGDDVQPSFALAKVENLQIVWTFNCEHGVLRGVEVIIDPQNNTRVLVSEPLEDVEFGPEQLLARLPISWVDERWNIGSCIVPLEERMWWSEA